MAAADRVGIERLTGPSIRRSHRRLLVASALALVAATGTATAPGSPAAAGTGDQGQPTDFGRRGPFAVGHTTLALGPTQVEVFYPAEAGTDGADFRYGIADAVPAEIGALLPTALSGSVEVRAVTGATPSADGPFPVVIDSPGVATDRRWTSRHLAHLATWGFVAATPDQPHLGLVAATTGADRDATAGTDARRLAATLDLLTRATIRRGDPLEGVMDTERVGVEGLDAGGAAALAFGRDPQVDVVIGFAPGPPVPFPSAPTATPVAEQLEDVPAPAVPTMVIAAERDSVIDTEAVIGPIVDWLDDATVAVLADTGHSVFLDICQTLWAAGGLDPAVDASAVAVDHRLLVLRGDGCDPDEDVEPRTVWPAIDHLVVAQYRAVLGPDQEGARRSLAPAHLAEIYPETLAAPSR